MMKQLIVLIGLVVSVYSLECARQGQVNSQYTTNLKVQLRLSSLESLLNKDCQSYLDKLQQRTLNTLGNMTVNGQMFKQVKVNRLNTMAAVNVSRSPLGEYIQLQWPRIDISIQADQLLVVTRATINLAVRLVSSSTHNYRLQLFFRQLSLQLSNTTYSSTIAKATQQGLVTQIQQKLGKTLGQYLYSQTNIINKQLASLKQSGFIKNYDLGLVYNYTLQPRLTSNDKLYELSVHGNIHHSYHWTNTSHPTSHLLSIYTNEPSFLPLVEQTHSSMAVRYLISDHLLSGMWGAQYEVSTALDQYIRAHMITVFQKYLDIGLQFDIETVDKLFNGLMKDSLEDIKEVKRSSVSIRINATNYPYFNLTSQDTVQVVGPMQLAFYSPHNQQSLASLQAQVMLSFTFKHLSQDTRWDQMQVQRLSIVIQQVTHMNNYIIPQAYSRQDIEAVKRTLNAFLYLSAKGIQNTINIHQGLNIQQFLPDITLNTKLGSKVPLLQLVKSKTQTSLHNKNIETFIDFKQIKDSFQQIVDKLKNYIFTKSDL